MQKPYAKVGRRSLLIRRRVNYYFVLCTQKRCTARFLRSLRGSTTCAALGSARSGALPEGAREPRATGAHMSSEKPKVTPAQPKSSDDLDKWIDSACENDPIEVVEFIDDEAGPPLSKDEIRQAWDSLSRWRLPADFRTAVHALTKRCRSPDWFNRPDLKFLHDAFVLAEVVVHLAADQVRLAVPKDQWPDGYIRVGNKEHNVEVTSAHGGRKLGAEYKNVTKPELVPSIAVPVGKIERDLDAAIQAKVDKHYGSRFWLVVYLNINDWFGIRQTEAESAIERVKRKHAQSFDAIYVLWKDKLL
jgi:hypothetical protein